MYCRNCAHQVNDKAIACPKCGVNPRSEKKYCPSCGGTTNANQVACTNCGVSLASVSPFNFDTSSLQKIDVGEASKYKSAICAGIALIGFFMTWINYNARVMGMGGTRGFSVSELSDLLSTPQINTILSPMVLYLFPLCMIGIILADFLPQIAVYKKLLSLASVALIVYAAIGIFTTKIGTSEMGKMIESLSGGSKSSFSAGLGFYISLLGTLASAFFSGLIGKK